mmetsp:Transcript_7331/g.23427  ORF Transcript_7331/g.23427 Transcript_7331/m.23427 type:complete len:283 (+) Transcript_7331:134-982(+)
MGYGSRRRARVLVGVKGGTSPATDASARRPLAPWQAEQLGSNAGHPGAQRRANDVPACVTLRTLSSGDASAKRKPREVCAQFEGGPSWNNAAPAPDIRKPTSVLHYTGVLGVKKERKRSSLGSCTKYGLRLDLSRLERLAYANDPAPNKLPAAGQVSSARILAEVKRGHCRPHSAVANGRDSQRHGQGPPWVGGHPSWSYSSEKERYSRARDWDLRVEPGTRPNPPWMSTRHQARVHSARRARASIEAYARRECQDALSRAEARIRAKQDQLRDYNLRIALE